MHMGLGALARKPRLSLSDADSVSPLEGQSSNHSLQGLPRACRT